MIRILELSLWTVGIILALLHPRSAWAGAISKREPPPGAVWISDGHGSQALVYPPDDPGPRPIFVMLHGMCSEPEHECPSFAEAIGPHGWLICPRGNARCGETGSTWQHPRWREAVERSVHAIHEVFPGELDESPGRTLIGFSLGGIVAMDIAHQGQGRYREVVLLGARVFPNASLLRRAGVARLVFAAGEYDRVHGHLTDQARRVRRQGLEARFVSLGKVGHAYPRDLTRYMDEILR